MLICPQCQFENPDTNKFCQSCGTSLENKTCDNCGASIPILDEKCAHCGESVRIVLWGIIAREPETEHESLGKKSQLQKIDGVKQSPASSKGSLSEPTLEYLDPQERYCLDLTEENPLKPISTSGTFLEKDLLQGKVIDLQPLQKSYLATIKGEQSELFAELEQDLNNSYLCVAQYWNLIGIPTHALPYLMMQKFTSVVPKIYDAWQHDERGVVLLSNRSSWNLLTDIWTKEDLPLLPILWSFNQMLKLWNPLHKINCTQSLLVKDNLRVDEDESFGLQQLYLDNEDFQPSLRDLGQKWQLWLSKSNITHYETLNELISKIVNGKIDNVEELSAQLHQIEPGVSNIEFEGADDSKEEIDNLNDDNENADNLNIDNLGEEFNVSSLLKAENQENQIDDEDIDKFDFFAEDISQEKIIYSSDSEEQPTIMLPMQLSSITEVGYTDIGVQRDHNEDFFGIQSRIIKLENGLDKTVEVKSLYVVCDGMGGHAAGEVASAMAVENLQKYFQKYWQEELPDEETIRKGILLANQALFQTNLDNSRSGSGRMGTTLVMALLQDTKLAIAHVGDSRIYLVTHQRGLEQLTTDHEVGQREINRGVEPEIAYGRPDAYQLTQALGPRDSNYLRPEIQFLEIKEDCLLLLCSDGLCDHNLLECHWKTYLQPLISSSANLDEGLLNLIDFANQYNGHDNITAVMIRIKMKPTL